MGGWRREWRGGRSIARQSDEKNVFEREKVVELLLHSSCTGCCALHAREELEVDHYGMDKVKKRVLEFLAVRQLKQDMKGWFWSEEGGLQ